MIKISSPMSPSATPYLSLSPQNLKVFLIRNNA